MSEAGVGTVVDGRYRLERLLGEGAAGAVYAATQLSVDRTVAVKLLHGANSAQFEAEARAIGKLKHSSIIALHDFGFDDELGAHFMVTEYVEGAPLSERMKEVMSTDLILKIALDVASALQHAHSQGIVHRDLKPENIMLTRADDRVDVAKVLDFGLAQIAQSDADTDAPPAVVDDASLSMSQVDESMELEPPEEGLSAKEMSAVDLVAPSLDDLESAPSSSLDDLEAPSSPSLDDLESAPSPSLDDLASPSAPSLDDLESSVSAPSLQEVSAPLAETTPAEAEKIEHLGEESSAVGDPIDDYDAPGPTMKVDGDVVDTAVLKNLDLSSDSKFEEDA